MLNVRRHREPRRFLRPLVVVGVFLVFAASALPAQRLARTVDSLARAMEAARARGDDTLVVVLMGETTRALWGTYPDSAMALAQKTLTLAESVQYRRGIGVAYNNIAYIHRKQGRHQECLDYSKKAIDILEPLGDAETAAWCYHNMGNVYSTRGRYDLALEHHFKALRLREVLNDARLMAWSLSNIADIYREQGYKEQSLEYTLRAIPLFQRSNDRHGMAVAMNSVGLIFQDREEYDSAMTYFTRALALDEESEHGTGIIWSARYCGELSLLRGRFAEALRYFDLSLQWARQINDRKNEAVSLLLAAKTFRAQGNLSEAFARVRAGLALADSVEARSTAQALLEELAELYAATGNFSRAYEEYRRAALLKDSLFSATSAKKIAELTSEIGMERRQKEIELLTKDNALQAAELRRQSVTRNALAAGLAGLIALIALLVHRYRFIARAREELEAKNEEILRQQKILEDQAAEIEIANTQLHEQNFQLQQLNAEKNEFLGIAAHDLKNPLSAIAMSASTARDYFDRLSREAIIERLSSIIASARRLADIISKLLDVNAIETGNLRLEPAPANLREIAQSVVEQYRERAQAKRIDMRLMMITTDVSDDDGGECEAFMAYIDKEAFGQIIDNLVSNALKYTPFDSRIEVRLRQSVWSETGARAARIEVQDEGPGVQPEERERLFGKFARLSAKPTGGENSTGLGLSIVKRLSEAMGGRVGYEPAPTGGSIFFVEFPTLEIAE